MNRKTRYKIFFVIVFLLVSSIIFHVPAYAGIFGQLLEDGIDISAAQIAGPYARIVAIATEPYLGIMIIGICENANSFFGKPIDIQSTLAGNPIILTIVTIMFIITKILKSNSGTKILGMVTLGEIEKKLSVIFPIILGIINIVIIIKQGNMDSSDVYSTRESMILLTILLSLISVIVSYIIKTVISCIEILELSLGFIPGFSFLCELAKSLYVIFLLILSAINPIASTIINIFIIVISLIVFRKCLSVVDYYKNIYLNGFLAKLNVRKFEFIDPKTNKIASRYFDLSQIQFAIPIFSIKRNLDFKKYEKYILVKTRGQLYLCKEVFLKRNKRIFNINTVDKPIYIQKNMRFIEIFTLFNFSTDMNIKKNNKDMAFALSNQYLRYYNFIVNESHFIGNS